MQSRTKVTRSILGPVPFRKERAGVELNLSLEQQSISKTLEDGDAKNKD